jgi:5-methylcytosine-specific restriction endonuclease McrA
VTGPRFPDAPGRSIPTATRASVMARDDYRCVYCGTNTSLTLDHVVPWIQGGDHDARNLVVACQTCNSIAGDRLFRVFSERITYVQARRAQLTPEQLAIVTRLGVDHQRSAIHE